MVSSSTLWMAAGLLLAASAGKDSPDNQPVLQLGVAKGTEFRFVVEREVRSSRGNSPDVWTSTVHYDLKATEKRQDGGWLFTVTYASVQARNESERGAWRFDSRDEPSSDDEIGRIIRKAVESPIQIVVEEGKISEITGFPRDSERGDRKDRFRRWLASQVAGQWTLTRDLLLVMPTPLWGNELKKGETYSAHGERDEGGDKRHRHGPPWLASRLAYRFEEVSGKETARVAAFDLSLSRRDSSESESRRRDRPDRRETGKGRALVSLGDGLVRELTFERETVVSGKFRDREFKFSQTSRVRVDRGQPREKSPPAAAEE